MYVNLQIKAKKTSHSVIVIEILAQIRKFATIFAFLYVNSALEFKSYPMKMHWWYSSHLTVKLKTC